MDLVTVVVVPAHDEQDRIGTCLEALAAQTVALSAFETILIADCCRDQTEQVARETAGRLGLSLTILQGPGGRKPSRSSADDQQIEPVAHVRSRTSSR